MCNHAQMTAHSTHIWPAFIYTLKSQLLIKEMFIFTSLLCGKIPLKNHHSKPPSHCFYLTELPHTRGTRPTLWESLCWIILLNVRRQTIEWYMLNSPSFFSNLGELSELFMNVGGGANPSSHLQSSVIEQRRGLHPGEFTRSSLKTGPQCDLSLLVKPT